METLEISIIPEDFKAAPTGYVHSTNEGGCVLWQALHRLYPGTILYVGTMFVEIGGETYTIDNKVWGTYSRLQKDAEYSPDEISELSTKAKESLEGIPTVTLKLTPHVRDNYHP